MIKKEKVIVYLKSNVNDTPDTPSVMVYIAPVHRYT